MKPAQFIPYSGYRKYPPEDMQRRAEEFFMEMSRRRSVRDFSSEPVSLEIIKNCIKAAGTSVSGANLQPWQFVVVGDEQIKHTIRLGAEEEERKFYQSKAPEEWLDALAPLGTDANKPFLDDAPWLIAIFQKRYGIGPDGGRVKHYYATESVGIATGILITAIHNAGLACLTHTPSPMGFLNQILDRPSNERPFVLLVVGYPAEGVMVPDIHKKSLDEISIIL